MRNLDAQINPNSIKIVSVENDDLNILHGMKLGDFMVFDVDKLNSYFIINNSDDYIDEVNPLKFGINSCYPNPFNPIVNIDYSIEQNSEVVVSIYDIRGNRVNILDKGYKFGENHVSWNGRDFNGEIVSSGVYFVEIKFISKDVKKVTLLNEENNFLYIIFLSIACESLGVNELTEEMSYYEYVGLDGLIFIKEIILLL